MPKSLIVTCPEVFLRALQAKRVSQERRVCARCARERITSSLLDWTATGGDQGGIFTSTSWWRTSCRQARRRSLRLFYDGWLLVTSRCASRGFWHNLGEQIS